MFKVFFEQRRGYRLVCSVNEMGKFIPKGDTNAGCLIKKENTSRTRRRRSGHSR